MKVIPARKSLLVAFLEKKARAERREQLRKQLVEMIVRNESKRRTI